MRTLLLSLAGAVSALAVATPASAQWAQPVPYGAPAYGYGYNNYGASNLQARISQVRQQIYVLQRQRLIGHEQAKRLSREARSLQERAMRQTYAPMNPYEVQMLSERVSRIERRLQYAASRGRYGYAPYGNAYGYNGYSSNRAPSGYLGQDGYYGAYGDRDRDDDRQGDWDDDDNDD